MLGIVYISNAVLRQQTFPCVPRHSHITTGFNRLETSSFCVCENNKIYLDAYLLSYLVSELQKLFSSGLETRTVFRNCDLYSCNLLFERNSFGLGVLLSCLSFRAIGTALAGNRTQYTFPDFWSYVPFLVLSNKHAKFGVSRFISCRATSEHTSIQKHCP